MKIAHLSFTLLALPALLCTASCSSPAVRAADTTAAAGPSSPATDEEGVSAGGAVTIRRQWAMPADLLEISGICWVDARRLACVQDEQGSIYIYNLATSRLEQEIPFGEAGDYEAIARAGDTYYVMRSDAQIFEVTGAASSGKPTVNQYNAAWDGKHDIESMWYDAAGKRLLMTDKIAHKKSEDAVQGIYAFDLGSKQTGAAPVMEISLEGPVLAGDAEGGKKGGGKQKLRKVQPSEMAIHPTTGDIYLADGPKSGLFITDRAGKPKQYIPLDKKVFPQPEGLAFSPDGQLFISSEGGKGDGVIAEVAL